MVRGRAAGRGTRRGAAAPGTRRPTETDDASASQTPGDAADATDAVDATASASTAPRTSGPAGPGTSIRRGAVTRGPAAGRFRPKNVRRDEAERDSLARQEQQKASDRAAEERRVRGRSRFRSKRSRGDTMGSRGGINRNITTASGPFSSGMAGSGPSRSGGWFGGGGSGSGFGSGSKSSGSFNQTIKSDKGLPRFGQAGYGGPRETRINADKLHALTPDEELDSDDEAMMAALSGQSAGILPMGIYRKEHKESGVVVATTAELEAAENANEEESLWVDGNGANAQPPAAQPEEEGIWDTGAGKPTVIKKEPENDDSMNVDAAVDLPMAEEKKPSVVAIPKKVIPQDPEDKIIQADLNLLASELGAITVTEDGETKTASPANKDGRMYLFQFPPLLPPLKQTSSPKKATAAVKEETDNLDVLSVPPSTGHASPVDLTQEEANQDSAEQFTGEPEDPDGFRSQLLSRGGMIGNLIVRKSGKVELDWGGRTLEMSPATGMNFLTSAVIVEETDEKPQSDVMGGEGIGMGKIMGRFVLAPVWSEEEEWNVDPEDLVAS